MNQMDRIYALHKVLAGARYPVPRRRLEERLECSPATIKRIIREMRDYLHAPIEYSREANGYFYADDARDTGSTGPAFELPGLWFNESEIVSLLVMDQLLAHTQPGFLDRDLAPVRRRLQTLLGSRQLGAGELGRRVRILRAAARPAGAHFRSVAGALLARQRLRIHYHGRASDRPGDREVSPQRLTHYRDNWYLDAWCHRAGGLRTFALDRIRSARALERKAKTLDDARLDAELGASYGIFSGPARAEAVLQFTPAAARWVADEQWHPQQQRRWLADGTLELRVPYARAEELIRDVLAHGPDCCVIAPQSLRTAVTERLAAAQARYQV